MSQETGQSLLPDGFIWSYWQATAQEIGLYSLNMIMLRAGLGRIVVAEKSLPKREPVSVAEFGHFQQALREYYGRGARGLLTRIGRGAWREMSQNLHIYRRIVVNFLRFLPASIGVRLVLNNLAAFLRYSGSWMSVQGSGKDLSFVDFSGLASFGQTAGEPVCWTMVGLIHGALESIAGKEYEIDEVSCRAAGSEACKFYIKFL